jgi:two-component system, NarL family, response regulator
VKASTPHIRVLCVDDHPVVRNGISQIIDLQPDMRVVASAATGEEAISQFRQRKPDITLMDLQLPGMSGLEALREIRSGFPGARIIVLTMYQGDQDIRRALEAGAATYLLKDTVSHDLIRTIRDVYDGKSPMSAAVAALLAERKNQPALTSREVEITELIAKGMRNKEIAAALGIAEETVHAHVKNIFSKLHVNDRTAALAMALRRGIIHIQS